ncbi:hypothetical protein GCM10009117_11880 [Gangjinia marincola]|uniref:Uncharacterized protein n=1 Tax=Gangjinia marincola TaxID=578463 RepID=A0ABN1MFV3_9FLAO
MEQNYKSEKFKKWLDNLQQESWQLELIISGFAIFGLFEIHDQIPVLTQKWFDKSDSTVFQVLISNFYTVALISWYILTTSLLVHLVLRGLWIGALGLRYVSGDIDFTSLNYNDKFTNYLKKRIGSYDKYISILEDYCSLLFALSFLLIFIFISFFTLLIIPSLFIAITTNVLAKNVLNFVIAPIIVTYFLLGLFILIDFLGNGILKKKHFISKIYFPIYKLFSYISLSFIYRPLLYNFLDFKSGRKILIGVLLAFILVVVAGTTYINESDYIVGNMSTQDEYANNANYLDQLKTERDLVSKAAINSKVITNPYLELFINYNRDIEDQLFLKNKFLKRSGKKGMNSSIHITFNAKSIESPDSIPSLKRYLQEFENLITTTIDNDTIYGDFVVTNKNNEQLGYETFLDISTINKGKHILNITYRNSDSTHKTIAKIPFWYYPDN